MQKRAFRSIFFVFLVFLLIGITFYASLFSEGTGHVVRASRSQSLLLSGENNDDKTQTSLDGASSSVQNTNPLLLEKKSDTLFEKGLELLKQVISSSPPSYMPSSDTSFPTKEEKDIYFTEIREALQKSPNAKTSIIVWLKTKESFQQDQTQFLSDLSAEEFTPRFVGKATSFIAGEISSSGIVALEQHLLVDFAVLDKPVYPLLAESRPQVRADKVEQTLGITGQNVGVCVIDTGVDYTHPSLGACTRQQFLSGQCSKVVGGYDFHDNDPDPMDDNGHGTHIAGIVASSNSQYRGIASGAKILALRALGLQGTDAVILASIDWCIQNAALYNIKVITMSIGDGYVYTDLNCPPTYNPAIQRAVNAGIFVDVASGNGGNIIGISQPACAKNVASVGAVYDANLGPYSCDPATTQDQLTCFTDRGSNLDLLAPGAIIRSTASTQGSICGAPNGGFGDCSGTSMAAPHVAGAAALLNEINSNLRPQQIETILRATGVPISDPRTSLVFPRIDTLNALQSRNNPLLAISGVPRLGNTLQFYISHPPSANKLYLLLFSTSTSPGITLPDSRIIPLTLNDIFLLSLTNAQNLGFRNSFGTFDSSGFAQIDWSILSFIPTGLSLYFSFITIDTNLPFPQNILAISPAYPLSPSTFRALSIKNASLPQPREKLSCASINQKIYCFGGFNPLLSLYATFNETLEYNPQQDVLNRRTAVLPTPRYLLSCASFPPLNKIYCFGGTDAQGYLNQIVEYDPVSDRIAVKNAVLQPPREGLSCSFSKSTNKIYCFGGFSFPSTLNDILSYDPLADILQFAGNLPSPRVDFSCVESSFNQKIYCFGGEDRFGVFYDTIIEYDPAASRPSPILKNARFPLGIAALSCAENPTSGKIYCFGGKNAQRVSIDKIFEYTPQTDSLRTLSVVLPLPLEFLSCSDTAPLANIYCLGGSTAGGVSDKILEYVPS